MNGGTSRARTLFLTLLLAAFPLGAQNPADLQQPISTDRPSVANSSVVVPKAVLQIENGLLITSNDGQHILDLPESSLRYGLFNKTELRLAVPNYFQDLGTGAASGFGDIAIGAKHQLGPMRGLDLSVIFFLSLPGGAHDISSHGYDPGLQFPWSHKLSANWTAGGQVAFYWPTQAGEHVFTGESTFYLVRSLARSWDAFAEYAGDFPRRGGPRHLLHFGSAYRIAPRNQIDFHVAAGLSRAAPDVFVGAGYSFLFRLAK